MQLNIAVAYFQTDILGLLAKGLISATFLTGGPYTIPNYATYTHSSKLYNYKTYFFQVTVAGWFPPTTLHLNVAAAPRATVRVGSGEIRNCGVPEKRGYVQVIYATVTFLKNETNSVIVWLLTSFSDFERPSVHIQ